MRNIQRLDVGAGGALFALIACSVLATVVPTYAAGTNYYVATTGSDSNPGTISEPFASIEGARDAIRTLKGGAGLPVGGVDVLIRGGTYPVTKSIILTSDDKGTSTSPIAYKAFPTEEVIFDGSKTIDLSYVQPVSNSSLLNSVIDATARANLKQIDLTAAGISPSDVGVISRNGFGGIGAPYKQDAPARFYIDQERQLLASWPNDMRNGVTIRVALDDGPTLSDGDMTWVYFGGTFKYEYAFENRPALWTYTGSNPDDLWIQGVFWYQWMNSRNKVKSIDVDAWTVDLAYGEANGLR
jgi:hypothetical protein